MTRLHGQPAPAGEQTASGAEPGYEINIEHVQKSFGTVAVLEDIDLTIPRGQFVALVGKSGCGKSTLLRLLSHLEQPGGGAIYMDGTPVERIDPAVRFLFQESRLLPWQPVWKNVALGAVGGRRDREAALAALRAVDLEDKANQWPELLSGGQKQRVSLARAMAGKPRVLLLDEPLGALDALTRINMQRLIETLWREQGCTVVLVTHDVSEAVCLADRVLLMEEGRITADIDIRLARPRVKDTSFAHYEKRILQKVMGEEASRSLEDSVFAI